MSKKIGYCWFNGNSTIGIVLCYDEITKELKSWIATCKGENDKDDLLHIQQQGMKFPIEESISLIKKQGFKDIPTPEFQKLVDNFLKKKYKIEDED